MLYPDFLDSFCSFGDITVWFGTMGTALGAVLVAAAAIYVAFIGWRAFKAACNKV